MQAWIVKHVPSGGYVDRPDDDWMVVGIPYLFSTPEYASEWVNNSKSPKDWKVVEVEITEK